MAEDLQSNALCTVEQARAWLRRDGIVSDVEDDLLTIEINAVSDAIEGYCNRRFLPNIPADDTDDPVERLFRYDGSGILNLAPYELRSLGGGSYGGTGSISVYSDTTGPSVLETTGYRFAPRAGSDEGTYYALELPRLQTPLSPYAVEVSVTGYWGVGRVPAAVRTACLIAVAANYRNPAGFQSQSLGEMSFTELPPVSNDDTGSALPAKARSFLWRYRR